MKKAALTLTLVFALLFSVVAGIQMVKKARAETIMVPDDYATIQDAINAAVEGDTIFVKKGTYEERQLIINKPLSIIGEGAELTKIEFDPPLIKTDMLSWIDGKLTTVWLYDFSIKVETDDLKLSGFTVSIPDGDLTGGNIKITGNRTQIVGNHITTLLSVNGFYWKIEGNVLRNVGAYGSYSNMAGNTFLGDISVNGSYSSIVGNTFSGYLWAAGSYLNISANSKNISNKVGTMDSGITVEGSVSIVYGNIVTAEGLVPGIGISGESNLVAKNIVNRSDVGLAISGSDNIIVANRITNCRDNSFVSGYPPPTSGVAIRVSGNDTFYANYVADNTWGADVNSFPENNLTSTFYNNNFVGNAHQVAAVPNFPYGNDSFDNGIEGNYWSDYNGTDADGDGIGDTPYIIDDKRQDSYPLMAPFDIDSATVELPEWASPSQSPSPSPSLEPNSTSAPFPTTLVIALVVIIVVEGIGLLIYFKTRKR